MVLGQSRVLEVESRLSHEGGLGGEGERASGQGERLSRGNKCSGVGEALGYDSTSKWKLSLEKW